MRMGTGDFSSVEWALLSNEPTEKWLFIYSLHNYFQSFAQNMISVGMDFSLKFDWLGKDNRYETGNATEIVPIL